MITHRSQPSKAAPLDQDFVATVHALQADGRSLRNIAAHLGVSFRQVRRAVQAIPVNGDAPVHPSASECTEATLQDYGARLLVLESFMATMQAHQRSASVHPSALQRTEPPVWVNRGTHLAADMVEAITRYAAQHRLERREVLDLALRRFFAGEGEQ